MNRVLHLAPLSLAIRVAMSLALGFALLEPHVASAQSEPDPADAAVDRPAQAEIPTASASSAGPSSDFEDDEAEFDAFLDSEFEDDFEEAPVAGFPDPFEPFNRVVFGLNRGLNKLLFIPLTKVYGWVVPSPARRGIRGVFRNLESPVVALNDVLQLEWGDAGRETTRFLFNTTIGIGGLWDAADLCLGIERHDSDFGQTLTLAGARSGPYLILPILGPSTVRDGTGSIIDAFMQPTTYLFGLGQLQIFYTGSAGFSELEENVQGLEALEESSVDFYAAMRNAYYQQRQSEIWRRRQHRR